MVECVCQKWNRTVSFYFKDGAVKCFLILNSCALLILVSWGVLAGEVLSILKLPIVSLSRFNSGKCNIKWMAP